MQKTGIGGTLSIRRRGRKPQALPARWLVTDAKRLADPLPAIARLKPGDGVLFRHYELAPAQRLALAHRMAVLCRCRGLWLLVAGDLRLALAVGADGLHLPQGLVFRSAAARQAGLSLVTAAAHDAAAVMRASRHGANAVFVSPVFPTASHPGAAGLGAVRFAALASLARRQRLIVYALGGMAEGGMRRLCGAGAAGFAAIGGLSFKQ